MRLSRSLSSKDLVKALEPLGYKVTRQTGSHIRMTCAHPSQHYVTIPNQDSIRIGTLSAILSDVAKNLKTNKNELASRLFDKK